MAAIPATQLTAQLASSVEAGSIVASAAEVGADAGLAFLFSDLLAQQMGVGLDGKSDIDLQDIDLNEFSKGDVLPELVGDSNVSVNLAQLQQVLIPPQLASVTTNAPVVEGDNDVVLAASPAISADADTVLPGVADKARSEQPSPVSFSVATNAAPERQPVAAELAILADADAVQVSNLPSGTLPEQVARITQQATVPAFSSAPVAGAIAQPVSSPAWGGVLGDRVMWMVGQQQQSAELRLNPPALGPLEVKLSMTDGQATLTFSTHHLPVKEALEAATPRLREMFGESGLNLGSVSVNVGTSPQQQQAEAQSSQRENPQWSGESKADNEFGVSVSTVVTELKRQGSGMVDYFA